MLPQDHISPGSMHTLQHKMTSRNCLGRPNALVSMPRFLHNLHSPLASSDRFRMTFFKLSNSQLRSR